MCSCDSVRKFTSAHGVYLKKETVPEIEEGIHDNHDEIVDVELRIVGELSRDDGGGIAISTMDTEVQSIAIEKDLDLGLFRGLRLGDGLLL
jgi:hypothetical protein